MTGWKFGTDGVRGVANRLVTPELALSLGRAAAISATSQEGGFAVLGMDTRRSGPMLSAALAAGFMAGGWNVQDLGVAPTGAISFLARSLGCDLAAVISASHNPAPDNGIKLIAPDGRKASGDLERAIEELIHGGLPDGPTGPEIGMLSTDRSPLDRYVQHLQTIVPERLDGLSVVLDCAHGAAYELASEVFRSLGATVHVIGVEPDGSNINQNCGATSPHVVCAMTKELDADIGIAFDGDADRAVFSDSSGRLINGDRAIAMWCAHWSSNGAFNPQVAVTTVMSNSGFKQHLQEHGIELHQTPVGDKYVSARCFELGATVGGEPSGHIVFPRHGPTGDGLVTALEVCRVLRREGRSANELYPPYEAWPQLMINVAVERRATLEQGPLSERIFSAERALEGCGRVLVRASGTQPMVRVMVEARDAALRDQIAEELVDALLAQAGGKIYSRVDLTNGLGD